MAITPVHPISLLLQAHVPLTLLLDLADATGPHSCAIYAAEGGCLEWADVVCGDIVWEDDASEALDVAMLHFEHV